MFENSHNGPAATSLGEFLRQRRRQIDPETPSLGFAQRTWSRVGRRVAQEEIAEAAGVTRQWYSQLERGTASRASTALLGRLATALMLDTQERATLLRLASPELVTAAPSPDNALVLEAYSWLRTYSRRLWNASSQDEALAIATEEVSYRFNNPPLIYTGARRPEGTWEWPLIDGDRTARRRFAEFIETFSSTLSADGIDQLRLYPLLREPGEVCTEDAFHLLSIGDAYFRALENYGFSDWSMLYGRVRSRRNFVAGITVRFPKHEFSAEDRAVLSMVTELTSLALS